MAAVLRIIKEDQLNEQIQTVFTPLILPVLETCQQQYEELVSNRMRREIGVVQDFRELRGRLRWLIGRYKSAVETLYDEDKPDTYDIVEDALRSLIMVSAHMSRSGSQVISEELDLALVDAQFFDELEATAEADGGLDDEDEAEFDNEVEDDEDQDDEDQDDAAE